MLELFAPVKTLVEQQPARIDNFAFRLHCRATVLVLLVCMILVTAKQYFGEPISCITDGSIERDSINTYCWIYGTFTVSRHLTGVPGRSVASPGVGGANEADENYYHRYYQWVCFVLGFQALMFYMPRALWTSWERGLVATLTKELNSPFPQNGPGQENKHRLNDYFSRCANRSHDLYALCFSLCELMNFLNTVGQIYILDAFLEGEFRGYGSAVVSFAVDKNPSRVDPMARLFPKVSKCTFRTFGATGSLQVHDALCVLALNVVNEKVFVFLWFWLMFLVSAGALSIVYRILVISSPWVRTYLLRATARRLSRASAEHLVRNFRYGDWFLLRRLASNVDPLIYPELLENLGNSHTWKTRVFDA